MSGFPSSSLLDETLRIVTRRYRLPALAAISDQVQSANSATRLAIAIELARQALARGEVPDVELQRLFTDALARMIQEAMRPEQGDPVFQAMVLRHLNTQVREYASLSAHTGQDRRAVHAAVNGIAHPAKQRQIHPGRQRDVLNRVHTLAASASWSALADTVRDFLNAPEIADDPSLARLLDNPALARLQRLEALASDELVRQYQSLWDRNGPRPGSDTAAAQGSASRQRGAAVEALAAQALDALARRLNETEGPQVTYRAVTSMRVPASIPASPERAKSEWDVVLLSSAPPVDSTAVWDICLLVEAKASVDAATTDLPRLLRGLRLLGHAKEDVVYSFETQEGTVRLRGTSLRALPTDEADLASTVLYCCDAAAETSPRLLSAASRMQLLSAPASLEFASKLAEQQHVDTQCLEAVWHQLLESPRWRAVLHQYPMLRQARELMVYTEDLSAAIGG